MSCMCDIKNLKTAFLKSNEYFVVIVLYFKLFLIPESVDTTSFLYTCKINLRTKHISEI